MKASVASVLTGVLLLRGGIGAFAAHPPKQSPDAKPPVYTLRQCLETALEKNPGLSAAAWDARAASQRWEQARGRRLPSIGLTAGYTYRKNNQLLVMPDAPMVPGTYSKDIVDADIEVSMPLYTAGRISDEIAAARFLKDAIAHRLVRSRRDLVFRVSSVYYSILGQRKVLESLHVSRKAIAEHRKRVRDLLDARKAARVDLLRTEVRLADLDQRIVAENNRLTILHRLMATLMGLPPEKSHIQVSGELLKTTAPTPDESESYRESLAQRADYRAALAEVDAEERRVNAARAARWPVVNLVGSYGGRWAPNPDIQQSGADDAEDVGKIGVRLTVPIFEGGRIMARIREETARLAAARERLNQLELGIRLEVQTAVLNIRSNLQRVMATEKAIKQADESLRIERQKYAVGKGSVTDVLDAQSALLDAQTSYYHALAGYHTSVAQWRLAVGKPVTPKK